MLKGLLTKSTSVLKIIETSKIDLKLNISANISISLILVASLLKLGERKEYPVLLLL